MAGVPQKIREVTPFIARIRNWLLSHKEYKSTHRYEGATSARSQEAPNLPPGVSSKLSANYYYTRDGRREMEPAKIVYDSSKNLLGSGETSTRRAVPGFAYDWDTGKFLDSRDEAARVESGKQ